MPLSMHIEHTTYCYKYRGGTTPLPQLHSHPKELVYYTMWEHIKVIVQGER